MVFGCRRDAYPGFDMLMRGVLNFPEKGQVVDICESRGTRRIGAMGLHCGVIFSSLSGDFNNADDTAVRWERLIESGFPCLKIRMVKRFQPILWSARPACTSLFTDIWRLRSQAGSSIVNPRSDSLNKSSHANTFACRNQVEYTRHRVESMARCGTPQDLLIVVDQASRGVSLGYLHSLSLGARIHNADNLGRCVAGNQGVLAVQAEWTIVMNSDVLVSVNWIDNLLGAAIRHGVAVISPALIEGKFSHGYDAVTYEARQNMKLPVHKSVWLDAGYFQMVPKQLGYDNVLFFGEMARARVPSATPETSWLYHSGLITQSVAKREREPRRDDNQPFCRRRLARQTWLQRKLIRLNRIAKMHRLRHEELAAYGTTVQGRSDGPTVVWN